MSSFFFSFDGKFHIKYALKPKQEVENQINFQIHFEKQKKNENEKLITKIKISQIFQVFLQCRKKTPQKNPSSPKQEFKKPINSTFTTYIWKLIATVKK